MTAAAEADRFRLGEVEHRLIFETEIVPELFGAARPAAAPVAVIFGGQPGAGKSAAVDAAARELDEQVPAMQVIGDDLRAYHPRYADLMARDDRTAAFYTDRDTGRWVEMAIEHAKHLRSNLVIEGTMRDADKVAQTMHSLRRAGYVIDARALAVNDRLSWQGVLQRYESQKADRGDGRMTTPQAHRAAHDGMLLTVERIESERLADRMTVYRRGGVVLYGNELRRGEWVHPPRARQAIERERSRPFTLEERRAYAQGFDKLATLMARPERGATAAELREVETLRAQAHRGWLAEAFYRR